MEIETQGTKIKIGEVIINMGEILNEKKIFIDGIDLFKKRYSLYSSN